MLIALRTGILAAIYAAAFTVLASAALLYGGSGLNQHFRYPAYQWWSYFNCCWNMPGVRNWLAIAAIMAIVPLLLLTAAIALRRRRVRGWSLRRDHPPEQSAGNPIRGTTDNHGHARWATPAEATRLWPGPDPLYGGIVVGEAYDPRKDRGPFVPQKRRTWGRGGKAALLIDPCTEGSTHSIMIAGSGAFKSTSAISTVLNWNGSAVVLDPAAELGPMLEADRLRLGHDVHILSPQTARECGFNVLDWIDISSPLAETDVTAVVEWVCGYTPPSDKGSSSSAFFKNMGKALVRCLLTHMLWDPDLSPELKTLKHMRAGLSVTKRELLQALKAIYLHSQSPLARQIAGPLLDQPDETFGGIYSSAVNDTMWLSVRAYADLVSGTSFRTQDVTNGKTDVFLSLPLKALQATPAVARCIIGALLNAVYEADGNVNGRVLFLLDEAARLDRMQIIETARDAGRKYGITLHMLYQSLGQIEQQWGPEGRRAWDDAVSWRSYAAIKDLKTAEEISRSLGSYGVLSWSESFRRRILPVRGSGNITYSQLSRRLMAPDEIMSDLREDAQIVIPRKGRPVLCGRAIYFRRPELVARVGQNRFARTQE